MLETFPSLVYGTIVGFAVGGAIVTGVETFSGRRIALDFICFDRGLVVFLTRVMTFVFVGPFLLARALLAHQIARHRMVVALAVMVWSMTCGIVLVSSAEQVFAVPEQQTLARQTASHLAQ